MKGKILLVEDDDGIRFGTERYLTRKGFEVRAAATCREARELFVSFVPHAVVTDYRLPDGEGVELVDYFRASRPTIPVIVLTGYATVELAVRAVKHGAENMLTKPVDLGALAEHLNGVVNAGRTSGVRRSVRSAFFGMSAIMRELHDYAERLRDADCSTLILGETGTGKTMLARYLHESGRRAHKPIVELNCAGFARDLVESELFGHERGAFTSAHAAKPGMFELADGGTLFLDEIGDVDISVQPKILKAIEEKRFRRMGSTREREVDARVIAATHRDLRSAAANETFRADLYYRLSTVTITVPPLRERASDIPLLARDLLETLAAQLNRETPAIDREGETALTAYHWPGNIRELKNVLERSLHLTSERVLTAKHFRLEEGDLTPSTPRMAVPKTLDELERVAIERALADHGHVGDAARSLGISRSTLYQKLKLYAIHPSQLGLKKAGRGE